MAANRFLTEVFLPARNRHFREQPAEEWSAFTPWADGSPVLNQEKAAA